MKTEDLLKRVDLLIAKASQVLATRRQYEFAGEYVDRELFNEFRTSSLSFLDKLFSKDHSYYSEFNAKVDQVRPIDIEAGRGILLAVKTEIESGWLFQLKDFISAEIFSDFLDMAEYLLTEGYKDPAAVMIGSVLEEHLRQLCGKNLIATTFENEKGILISKKADSLNSDLSKANIYNKLDQKNLTAWLDLRNKAAHGKYTEYNKEQVESFFRGVSEFIARNNI